MSTPSTQPSPEPASLGGLLDQLRAALSSAPGAVEQALRESADRLRADPPYAAALRADVRRLLADTNATHLLTEGGILSDEGLIAGVFRRVGARVAPAPPLDTSLEAAFARLVRPSDRRLLDALGPQCIEDWTCALLAEEGGDWNEPAELASALVILATRIAGDGVNARLTERVPSLEAWGSPFLELSRQVDDLAERLVERGGVAAQRAQVLAVIERCVGQLGEFRAQKRRMGTTLRLSSSSLRMGQQLERLRLLVECTLPPTDGGARAAAALTRALLMDRFRARPTLHFVGQKLDLLSFLAVGHAAQKGARYAVHGVGDSLRFLRKSFIGGVLVAIFASLKIHLSHAGIAPVPQALIYGLNYAVCFALIYLWGATLATKQPALTASRLAEALEAGPGKEDFAYLVRAIWRSQFISFVGNIVGAAGFAMAITLCFSALFGEALVTEAEARALAAKIDPLESGSVFYAAVAGAMLAFSGLFAGFIDNAVIFHRVGDRVRAGTGVFGAVSPGRRERLAERVMGQTGALSGNILLGFMLGSAGMLGIILGVPFDIRHIAFSSSHGALALWHAPELATWATGLWVLLGVLIIGLVNFLVSFGLTLGVAVTSRRVNGIAWRARLGSLWSLLRQEPLQFFIPLGSDPPNAHLDESVDPPLD